MQHYNQLMYLNYEGIKLKFDSLIIFKYFQIISKKIEFKNYCENIKNLIQTDFELFYNKYDIKNLPLNVIDDYLMDFKNHIIEKNNDILFELYEYILNNVDDKLSLVKSVKVINLNYDEFKNEIIKAYFFKTLDIRNKFYA